MVQKLKATPELEDFGHKYTKNGRIGKILIDNYFVSVSKLINKILNKDLKTVLEIGCGEGYSTETITPMLPKTAKFSASEYVDKLVPLAQRRNPRVNIMQEDVYRLKRKNDSFDLVFLLEVLEHLDYPEKALVEIKRVSSKYLILGVPREPIWRILNMSRGKFLKDFGNTPGHLNHWSSNGIQKLIETNYGEIIAVEKPLPWTILLAKKSQ